MKKYLLSIILLVMLMPFVVNAKEYCKIVSGSGKELGDEIACGTEHFYVLENNDDSIRMLAKYNLYTGYIIERVPKENDRTCSAIAQELGGSQKSYYGYFSETNYVNENDYCYVEKEIETDMVLQSSEAIGAHVDENGNYLYPQVGDNYLQGDGTNSVSENIDAKNIDNSFTYSDPDFMNFIINPDNTTVLGKNLLAYKNALTDLGYEVENIDILALSELDSIIHKTANKTLPLVEWGDNVRNLDISFGAGGSVRYNILGTFGNIKDYIPEEYSWLYSTTYWNKTVFYASNPNNPSFSYVTYGSFFYVFTGSMGKLCAAGFPYCVPVSAIGCGIRPVVTINNSAIQYSINTKTDGNGTIEVVENSLGGEEIQFKITAKEEYKLNKLIITTDSGEKVEFSEGEIIQNDDGTISIDKNKFLMPFENVTIEAEWAKKIINPETGSNLLIVLLILVPYFILLGFYRKKKRA